MKKKILDMVIWLRAILLRAKVPFPENMILQTVKDPGVYLITPRVVVTRKPKTQVLAFWVNDQNFLKWGVVEQDLTATEREYTPNDFKAHPVVDRLVKSGYLPEGYPSPGFW